MTTEATENPQVPQPPVMEVAEVFRILGRLEQAQQGTRKSKNSLPGTKSATTSGLIAKISGLTARKNATTHRIVRPADV